MAGRWRRLHEYRLRLLATAAAAMTALLFATAALMLYDGRVAAHRHAEQVTSNLALSIERDIMRNIELYDLSLKNTQTGLELAGLASLDPETRHAVLFDNLPAAVDFGSVIVVDAEGKLIAESGSTQARDLNVGQRDWFNFLKAHPDPGLHLSLVTPSLISGRQSLVLSRRLNQADGSFAGAVVGGIYLDYFQKLFSGLTLDDGNVAMLTTLENRIISRRPHHAENVGRIIEAPNVLAQMSAGSAGTFEHRSVIDHIWRLYAFRQVGNLPLALQVGLSWESVYGEWARKAIVVGGLLAGFAVVTGLLFLAISRELKRRLQLEGRLRESEASFRLLTEHASDMVTRVGPDGDRLYASPATGRVFGVPPATLIQAGVLHFVHRDDRAAVHQFQQKLLEGAVEDGTLTFRVMQPEKGETWVESTATSIVDPHSGVPDGYVAILREVTERKRAEASMTEANRWLTLSEQVGNLGHWRYTPANGRLHWSTQVYRIYGLDPGGPAPTLKRSLDACHPLDRQPLLDAIAAAIDEQAGFSIDVRVRLPDEAIRHVQIRAVVETGADHGLTALFGIVVDVTDQVRAATALQEHAERERHAIEITNAKLERLAESLAAARDEAQQANRAKSRFLAGMSHELRTPLNGILGYAHLLARAGELNPVQAGQVNSMLMAGQHLLDMVNQVLSLAEVELGQTELRLSDIDPAALSASCIDLIRPAADAKGLHLDLCCDAGVPSRMTTDGTRLRQIVLNILGNAVKFTERGSVSMHLRMMPAGTLRFEVADTGPGICPTKRHRLFQDFDRLDTQGALEGAGLGLALSAQLATALGGELSHDDNAGGGSRFWLELPVGTGTALTGTEVAALAEPLPVPSARRVLVVDDVAMNRDIAGAFLRTGGYTVELASSGAEAVTAAEGVPFDLILMDIRMPGMDGLEATRRVRALPGHRGRVPIVALTAQAFADQLQECERAGMDGHLTKPFTPEALLQAVALAIGKGRTAQQGDPALQDPASNADGVTLGSDFSVLDDAMLQQTASYLDDATLITYLQAIASRSRDLSQALRRPGALAADAAAIAAAAHTLAGSAAMLGFTRLSELSRRLERELELGTEQVPDVAAGVAAAITVSLEAMRALESRSLPVLEATG